MLNLNFNLFSTFLKLLTLLKWPPLKFLAVFFFFFLPNFYYLGFSVYYVALNLGSNDAKYTFVAIYSRFNQNSSGLFQFWSNKSSHGIVGRHFAVVLFLIVPMLDVLQRNKSIWSHLTFSEIRGWVQQKTSFWRFAWQIGYCCCPLASTCGKSQIL